MLLGPPRPAEAVRFVNGLAQHSEGIGAGGCRLAQVDELAAQPVTVRGRAVIAAEVLGQERSNQLQAAPLQALTSDRARAGTQVVGRPSSVPRYPMPSIQSSISSGPGIQMSSTITSSTPNEQGALATGMRLSVMVRSSGFLHAADQGVTITLVAVPPRSSAIPSAALSSGSTALTSGRKSTSPDSTSLIAGGKVKLVM